MTPNKENIRKVVDALRSGDYVQGKGTLEYKDENGVAKNCCLGVACRVAMANGVALDVQESTTEMVRGYSKLRFFNHNELVFGETGYLPKTVRDWLGVPFKDVSLMTDPGGYSRTATYMNDNDYSFEQIADAFERTFLDDSPTA